MRRWPRPGCWKRRRERGWAYTTAVYENIVNGTEIFGEYKKDGEQFGTYPFGSVIVTKDNYTEIMGDAAN